MKMKWIAGLFAVALVIACSSSEKTGKVDGSLVFKTHCQLCHGADGKLGLNGAKDLTASALTKEERIAIITKGKNTMLAYENTLSPEEIEAVANYTISLKK